MPTSDLSSNEDPAQRSARALQRITAMGEMTSGIAHDFRNILAVINSGLSLAQRGSERSEPIDAYLLAAREGVERGLRLTSRLLAFAQPHKAHVEPENFNILIRDLELFLKYGAGPGIRVVLDLAEPLPLCRVDRALFNASILNLVVNSRDAMSGSGEIRICTRTFAASAAAPDASRRGDFVGVRVTDNGQGMPAEILQRVFDPYFTTKGKFGTGLGVPQVKAFVEAAGGHVRVTTKPGVGTSFDLIFPAHDNEQAVPDGLWRQLDRWTNEGGAPDLPSAAPQSPRKHRRTVHRSLGSHSK